MGDMDTFYNKLFKQTIFVLQMVFQSVVQPTRIIESEARKMAGSDPSQKGKPLQIISIVSEDVKGKILHKLKLNKENLKRIMLHADVKDNPVMIVSIAGALRKGKSFLLGFFLKYLEAEMGDDWLKENDMIKGFEWRNGTDAITQGIQIWSEPFVFEKVAILLMDTQGMFDSKSTKQDCANIFTLSGLISSVQIYNLMQQIQENDLENLELFSALGKLIQTKSGLETKDTSNPKLIFLIRDWGCPHDFQFGKEGGAAYVEKQIQGECNQQQQLKNTRIHVKEDFPKIGGFLLPYPGKKAATTIEFRGRVQEIDDEFVDLVKKFVTFIIPPKKHKWRIKRINGKDVTGKDMLHYIEIFVCLLREGNDHPLETALEATAKSYRSVAFGEACKLYGDEMEKFLKEGHLVDLNQLKAQHTIRKEKALKYFEDCPRLRVDEHEKLSFKELKKKIKDKYHSYVEEAKKGAEACREGAVNRSYKKYEDTMDKKCGNPIQVPLKSLEENHKLTKDQSLNEFKKSPRINVPEEEEKYLKKLETEINRKYSWYQDQAKKLADMHGQRDIEIANESYKEYMEKLFKLDNLKSLDDLKEQHKVTKAKVMESFRDSPRIKVPEKEEYMLNKLEKALDKQYGNYEKKANEEAEKSRKKAYDVATNAYEENMKQHLDKTMFLTLSVLNTLHTSTKDELLKTFDDSPRIKVDQEEKLIRNNLEEELDKKKKPYEQNTIEGKIKNGALKIAIPGLSITSIAGIVLGTVAESPIVIGGAFCGLVFAVVLQIRNSI